MNKLLLKKIIPYIVALLIFVIISLVYFSPVLEGEKMHQTDIVNGKGMSKEIVDFRNETGKEALWTNSMFGGMPAFQISVRHKSSVLRYVRKIFELGLPRPANYFLLYAIGFFILLLILGVNPWLSIPGAIAFAFSSYFFIIIGAGHIWKVYAIAFMAPTLAGIILVFRKKYLLGGILTTLFLTLEILSNHPQMTYYFALFVSIIVIAEFIHKIKEKQVFSFFKSIGIIAIAGIIAVGVNITSLWSTYEYGKETIRGKSELTDNKSNKTTGLDKDYITQWSYGIGETFSLMIPDVKGGETEHLGKSEKALKKVEPQYRQSIANMNHYWGNQPFTSGPTYVGAFVVFLFILGLFIVKGRFKWALLIATILSILLAWGKNFMGFTDLFIDYFPLYNKFRAVASILVIAELTIPLLAMLTLKNIYEKPDIIKEKRKYFFIALSLTAGLSLLFYLLPSTFFNFFSSQELSQFDVYRKNGVDIAKLNMFISNIEAARIFIFKSDAIRSFWFIMIGAILLYLFSIKKLNKTIFIISLIIIITIDLAFIDKRYLNKEDFRPKREMQCFVPFPPKKTDFQILEKEMGEHPELDSIIGKAISKYKKENKRVTRTQLNVIPFRELNKITDYRVLNLTVSIFQDASTSYLHKSIGGYHGAKLKRYQELYEYHISKNNFNVLNMLNTKYIIFTDKDKIPQVQKNPDALGSVWIVDNYKLVNNADQEIKSLDNFNAASITIIDKRFKNYIKHYKPGKDSLSSIKLIDYKPNHLTYKSETNKRELSVFSEIYYKNGWNAYVDGNLTDYFRANYVLRAMIIPKGTHTIEFKFEPKSYYVGEKISTISLILLFILIIGGLGFEIKTELKHRK